MLQASRTRCALLFLIVLLGTIRPARAANEPSAASPPHRRPADIPRTGESKQVSLDGILAYASQHAPALLEAQAKRNLGTAGLEAASVLLRDNPEFEAAAGPKLGGSRSQGVEIEARIAQPIEVAGQRSLRIEAAEARARLYDLSYQQRQWVVHRQVHEAFHLALVARERAAVARRILAFATRLDEITQRQLEAGEISNVEARLASGALAQARQARVAAEGLARLARIRLAEVSGWPATAPPQVAGQLDLPRPPPPLIELNARANAYNPGLLTHAQAMNVAQAEVAVANREAWPTPTVALAYGLEREPGKSEEVHVGLVTLGIPLPLWNRNRGARARARALSTLARARHEATQHQIAADLAHAHAAVDVAATRIAAFGDEVIPAFEDNLTLLERAYELGEIDLLQVMVARGRFLEVEREALSAYDDYFASVARLEALLGTEVWQDERHGRHGHHEGSP